MILLGLDLLAGQKECARLTNKSSRNPTAPGSLHMQNIGSFIFPTESWLHSVEETGTRREQNIFSIPDDVCLKCRINTLRKHIRKLSGKTNENNGNKGGADVKETEKTPLDLRNLPYFRGR